MSSAATSASRRSTRQVHGRRSALLRKSLPATQWLPTRTLSSTVMVRNSARFWNVRPMPIMPPCGAAAKREMLRPAKTMSPSFGV